MQFPGRYRRPGVSTQPWWGEPEFDLQRSAPRQHVERVQGQVQQQLLELVRDPLPPRWGWPAGGTCRVTFRFSMRPRTSASVCSIEGIRLMRRRSGRGGRAKSRNAWRVRSIRRISCSMTRRSSAGRPRELASLRLICTRPLTDGERVPQLVGHAGGQLADHRHLIGPEQVPLALLLLVPLALDGQGQHVGHGLEEVGIILGELTPPGGERARAP